MVDSLIGAVIRRLWVDCGWVGSYQLPRFPRPRAQVTLTPPMLQLPLGRQGRERAVRRRVLPAADDDLAPGASSTHPPIPPSSHRTIPSGVLPLRAAEVYRPTDGQQPSAAHAGRFDAGPLVGAQLRVTFSEFDVACCSVVASRVVEGRAQHQLRFADEPGVQWWSLDELAWELVSS